MERTPQPAGTRLPRILSRTKETAERKREKQRERQARRRERIRQERMTRNPSTSSESDRDHSLQGDGGGDFNADSKDEFISPAPFREAGAEDFVMIGR